MSEKLCCWLGIDLGTTSVKVVVIDNNGSVLNSASKPTEAYVTSDIGDVGFEQNPTKIISTVEDLIFEIATPHNDHIKGIGITGQMHGVMLWSNSSHKVSKESSDQINASSNGCLNSCGNLYTWQDQRCTPDFLASLPATSDPAQPVSSGYGCATLFWLARYHPKQLHSTVVNACGTVMDYLVCLLCDLDHPITSDQLATSFGYYDEESNKWEDNLSKTNNFPQHLLPSVEKVGTLAGKTTNVLGLPAGIPVLVAMGDVQCAMYATLHSPLDAAINISTSIQLGFISPQKRKSDISKTSPPCITFIPYFKDQTLALFAGLNGGNAIECFVEGIAKWMKDLGISPVSSADIWSKLQTLSEEKESAETETATAVFKPVFYGERYDKDMKASIEGLNFSNFSNIGQIYRSLSNGIVDHLHNMISPEYLIASGISRLLVCGSVPVNNPIVMRRLLDVYTTSVNKDSYGCEASTKNVLPHGIDTTFSSAHSAGDFAESTSLNYKDSTFKDSSSIRSGKASDNEDKMRQQNFKGDDRHGGVDSQLKILTVEMATTGFESVSSAIGAARFCKKCLEHEVR